MRHYIFRHKGRLLVVVKKNTARLRLTHSRVTRLSRLAKIGRHNLARPGLHVPVAVHTFRHRHRMQTLRQQLRAEFAAA